MPQDNIKAQITNTEALAFIKYFVGQLKGMGIPWTLNALEIYYDSKASQWYDKAYKHKGMHITQEMDWPQVRNEFIKTSCFFRSDYIFPVIEQFKIIRNPDDFQFGI